MEITPQILISAGGIIFSILGAYGASRYAAGKAEQRLTSLEAISEQRDDTLHKRITKAQEESTRYFDKIEHTLEKLDNRIISFLTNAAYNQGKKDGSENG